MTARSIASMVANELDAPDSTSIAYCDVMEMLARLEGTPLRRADLLAAATVGGAIRRVDDVFDTGDIRDAESEGCAVTDAIITPDTGLKGVDDPQIVRAISMAGENFTPAAYQALQDLMRAQAESIRQRRPETPTDVIEDISRRKATFFLFAAQVSPDMTPGQETCYKELAYLLQLIDDYADRYQDTAEGIHTLVTRSTSDANAMILVLTQYQRVRDLFSQEYAPHQLIEPFSYVDQLLRMAGIRF